MKIFFNTKKGKAYLTSIEKFLDSKECKSLKGKVQLIFTSPPFPLVVPKKYGNKQGEEYLDWMSNIAIQLSELLTPDGSMVIEIGNAWDKGSPTMSTLPLRTLLTISENSKLNICQQFIWHNTAKLPGPATWVNVNRERVTDSFTHIWWYSKNNHPKANNRNILVPYSEGMKKLLKTKKYNSGLRPSGHKIGEKSFLTNNAGAIPNSVLETNNDSLSNVSSVIKMAHTGFDKAYREWCKEKEIPQHPARMPISLAEFFIKFLTDKNQLVFDPFGGSCTTGKAAENLGRKWIVTEQNKDYLTGAKGRFI
jgi:site-specific DNA-methyltransferase (cytosine-N4-specific)